jgi:hypothetical protein
MYVVALQGFSTLPEHRMFAPTIRVLVTLPHAWHVTSCFSAGPAVGPAAGGGSPGGGSVS